MSESTLKIRVRAAIRKKYPDAWFWKIHDDCTPGIPDILLIWRGIHLFIELKDGYNYDTTPIQRYTIEKITCAGGQAFVCRSVDQVMMILDLWLKPGGRRELSRR